MSKRVGDDSEKYPIGVKRPKEIRQPFERIKIRMNGMSAYDRHKLLMNNYYLYYTGATKRFERDASSDKNDYDIIRENHRFLWDEKSLIDAEKNWDAQLAKRYYDKLFKEYCIADLSQYENNRFAMRWRVEEEVKNGKGQFICGSKKCNKRDDLLSWEVNFAYAEHGEKKNALVKLRLCPDCSLKLNYHSKKRLIKKEKRATSEVEKADQKKRKKKHKKKRSKSRSKSPNELKADETPSVKVPAQPDIGGNKKNSQTEPIAATSASDIWTRPAPSLEVEKSKDDELDEFLDDLLF